MSRVRRQPINRQMADSNLAQVIADPLVQVGSLALAGAIVTRIVLHNRPKWRLVGHLAFFTGLTILLLYHGVVPYEPGPVGAPVLEAIFIGIAKIIWWINAAWALIGFVRVFLNFERRPREGRLIQDLVVGIIYLGASLSVIARTWRLGFPARISRRLPNQRTQIRQNGAANELSVSGAPNRLAMPRGLRSPGSVSSGYGHKEPREGDGLATPAKIECG